MFTADLDQCEDLKKYVSQKFQMKDLGEISQLLGCRVRRVGGNVLLDQAQYITTVLERFDMSDCKSFKTPMEEGLKLRKGDVKQPYTNYQKLIGQLMYISVMTRPDITYSVNYLSRFTQ